MAPVPFKSVNNALDHRSYHLGLNMSRMNLDESIPPSNGLQGRPAEAMNEAIQVRHESLEDPSASNLTEMQRVVEDSREEAK